MCYLCMHNLGYQSFVAQVGSISDDRVTTPNSSVATDRTRRGGQRIAEGGRYLDIVDSRHIAMSLAWDGYLQPEEPSVLHKHVWAAGVGTEKEVDRLLSLTCTSVRKGGHSLGGRINASRRSAAIVRIGQR